MITDIVMITLTKRVQNLRYSMRACAEQTFKLGWLPEIDEYLVEGLARSHSDDARYNVALELNDEC